MTVAPASYEAAVDRIEEIIKQLDTGQPGLRETLDLCREGRELIEYAARARARWRTPARDREDS